MMVIPHIQPTSLSFQPYSRSMRVEGIIRRKIVQIIKDLLVQLRNGGGSRKESKGVRCLVILGEGGTILPCDKYFSL